MSADLDGIARQLVDAIHASIDELEPDLRPGTHESCRSNLGLIMTMLSEGTRPALATPPPEALAYAREYVRRGHGFELLQRAYRTAQATFSQLFLDELRARADDAEELAAAFGFFNDWLFAWVEALESRLTEHYMRERERHLRGTSAMRAEVVRAVLEGSPLDPYGTSARLRYELDRKHLAFVIWAAGTEVEDGDGNALFEGMERLAVEVARLLGALDHLTVPLRGYLACWAGFRAPIEVERLPRQLPAAAARGLSVALGAPGEGVAGFRRSHHEALLARRVHRLARAPTGECFRFDDVALEALLTHDEQEAQRFVRRQLGELMDDSANARRLRETLGVFLDENASYVHAARRLGVHENTVGYRVRRVEELLGRQVKDFQLELRVALRLSRLVP